MTETSVEPLPSAPSRVDAVAFKSVFRHHPAGVAVVCFPTPSGPAGFTASSLISVSADPAAVAFSVAAGSSARASLEVVTSVVVNLLADDQAAIAVRFATRGVDRFGGVDWCELPTGEPALGGVRCRLRATVERRIPVGGSLLVVLGVTDLAHVRDAGPLVYEDRTYRRVGPPVPPWPRART